jgi:hypothetical protein
MARRKQDNLSKEELLLLKESSLVVQMANSEGYNQVVRPTLEAKLNQSFPDPSEFDSDEAYLYAAKTASIFKKVIAELLIFMDGHRSRLEFLDKKMEGKTVDKFEIGKE